ncbi:hypothetical protein [Tenacibaculum ovolyticum]|uniref:hypothetical protein n=1 Tax=Tenacibaculum ovolyticum TaxID=104270 RepID=UPI000401309A|nr:hypothetical protein [Tenacibaculum ovolyticum]
MNKFSFENSISRNKNFLINLSNENNSSDYLDYLINNFCGTIVNSISEISSNYGIRLYVIGDIKHIKNDTRTVFIIKDLSSNYENLTNDNFHLIQLGQVPINIHNAGVFYRRYFDTDNFFSNIESEHKFQNLTESNKQSTALRKGIYLSNVIKQKKDKTESLHFHLLRCSSNLTGPTDNFRPTDNQIIDSLNKAIKFDFEKETKLNHVLAQIYLNKKNELNSKEVKAKIGAHSDKTKDMAQEGLITFCTFYDKINFEYLSPSKTDKFDWVYKKNSGFTRLLFKLKTTVNDNSLIKEFSVTLYPNSVFSIPLSTNRLYTHEIRPSVLSIDKIPVRMGYVIRCSNLEAVYENNETFIKENGHLIRLEQMNNENMENLRDSYYKENKFEKSVDYGKIHFSMNSGDYKKPIY